MKQLLFIGLAFIIGCSTSEERFNEASKIGKVIFRNQEFESDQNEVFVVKSGDYLKIVLINCDSRIYGINKIETIDNICKMRSIQPEIVEGEYDE